MNTQKGPLPKVPPFVERKSAPMRSVDTRGMLSIVTMLVSLAALTVSVAGASKLVFDVFNDGLTSSLEGVLVKVGVLGLAFFFGWIMGLASIRAFGNLIYPFVIRVYIWGCLAAVVVLYIKVIQKLYLQTYDGLHYWAYLAILLGGLAVLLCLHLLIEDDDLRPYALPVLLASVIQLFFIIYRYIFATPKPIDSLRVIGDFVIFFVMITTSALMLMHLGIFSPLRDQLRDGFLAKNSASEEE